MFILFFLSSHETSEQITLAYHVIALKYTLYAELIWLQIEIVKL